MTATRPTAYTRTVVLSRDQGCCAICGKAQGTGVHHRRPAGAGGTRRPESHLPANLLSACNFCNTVRVEKRTQDVWDNGWLLRSWETPDRVAVLHALHGWVLLDDAGGWRRIGEWAWLPTTPTSR